MLKEGKSVLVGNNGFTVFFQDKELRICSISRLVGFSKEEDATCYYTHLDLSEGVAIEEQIGKDSYYVISFVRLKDECSPVVEIINDRVSLYYKKHPNNARRYMETLDRAIKELKDYYEKTHGEDD